MAEPIAVVVLAKAPTPGFAKTRLIPALGAEGAARLQARLTERAVATACAAAVGPVALWCAPDVEDALFARLGREHGVARHAQPAGDLGARMLAPLAAHAPALLVGVDIPALTADHLRACAAAVRAGDDAVFLPTEDGGYCLVGVRRVDARLFDGVAWSTPQVMEETRGRLRALGWRWSEPATLWDVDTPADLERLRRSGLSNADF
jgi:rSAM/selenodomain-associated transferase 1